MFEAHMFLNTMSLRSIIFQDFLIVMRSDFDVILSEEPFIARTLYYSMTTCRYMARTWERTVTSGHATSLQQFTDACKSHFKKGRLCLGYPDSKSEADKVLVSQTPISRRLSKSCHGYLGELDGPNVTVCSSCTRDVGVDLQELNDHNDYCRKNPVKSVVSESKTSEINTPNVITQTTNESINELPIQSVLNISFNHVPLKDLAISTKESEGSKDDSTTVIKQWDMVLQKNIIMDVPATTVKPKKCEDCEKEFASEQGLLAHRRTEHSVGPFSCLKCSFKVWNRCT